VRGGAAAHPVLCIKSHNPQSEPHSSICHHSTVYIFIQTLIYTTSRLKEKSYKTATDDQLFFHDTLCSPILEMSMFLIFDYKLLKIDFRFTN